MHFVAFLLVRAKIAMVFLSTLGFIHHHRLENGRSRAASFLDVLAIFIERGRARWCAIRPAPNIGLSMLEASTDPSAAPRTDNGMQFIYEQDELRPCESVTSFRKRFQSVPQIPREISPLPPSRRCPWQ